MSAATGAHLRSPPLNTVTGEAVVTALPAPAEEETISVGGIALLGTILVVLTSTTDADGSSVTARVSDDNGATFIAHERTSSTRQPRCSYPWSPMRRNGSPSS